MGAAGGRVQPGANGGAHPGTQGSKLYVAVSMATSGMAWTNWPGHAGRIDIGCAHDAAHHLPTDIPAGSRSITSGKQPHMAI